MQINIVSDAKTFRTGFERTGDRKFLAVDGSVGANKIVWQQEIEVKENTLYFFSAWACNLYTIYPAVHIEIAGHTDHVGEEDDNLKLSQDRANAIGRYLIDKNLEADRLLMQGYAEQAPIASNEILEGRQKNRRVEFTITKL